MFSREESVEFLDKRVPGTISRADAARLAGALGDLPLALEQAGALQAETGMPVEEYLRLLDERASQLLAQGKPSEYPVSMTAAWGLSVAKLSEQVPEAVTFSGAAPSSGPSPFPARCSAGRAGLGAGMASLIGDPIRLSRTIGELGRYALAKINTQGRTIQVHRLVQALVQDELSLEERQRIQHEVHLLLAGYDAGDPGDEVNWPEHAALLGHLEPSGVAGSAVPEVRGFAVRMLRYLFGSGDYESARKVADGYIEHWGVESGPEHPDVILVKLELTNTLRELGQYEAATALNAEVLAAAEKVHGLDDPVTLR